MTEGGAQMDQEGALALFATFKPALAGRQAGEGYSRIWSFGEMQVTGSPQGDG